MPQTKKEEKASTPLVEIKPEPPAAPPVSKPVEDAHPTNTIRKDY